MWWTLSVLLVVLQFVIRVQGSNLSPQSPNVPHSLLPRALPVGTCNAQTPCVNGACCGSNNLCGYSPTSCGTGCQSNCDAKAACGQYAAPGKQKCPLNVCCSQFGFCGTTSDFCGKGCDSTGGSCGPPNRPSCGGGKSASDRTIAYYESWSNTRKCQNVAPEDLNLNGYNQANFAFAFFDPQSFLISPMDAASSALYTRFTGLKNKYSGLETWISVGGWSFTDPGSTRTAFSDMSSSSANRQKFISGLINFMNTYGFDGVDLDWEYPGADDRGGVAADAENYVALVKDIRTAFGSRYGLSVTLPTSYWYLQHFDLVGMQDSVDFFGLMAYDLHGTWDAQSIYVGPYIAPHTNLSEIDQGLDLLWYAGVLPNKIVMGLAYYGRSFTLSSPSCNTPNGVCKFSGGANAGPCSATSGILDDQEIQNIISTTGVTPVWDKTAGVKWITWNSNQWVSYDDKDTFAQKQSFANSRCLNGQMVWAVDQVDQTAGSQIGNGAGVSSSQQSTANQMSSDHQAGVTCYTTDCGQKCKKGTNQVTQMNGQPGQLSTQARCPKGQYQSLCCDDGTIMGLCNWRGFRGVGLSCIGGCADGQTQVAQSSNHHDKGVDQSCNGGLQSYCCSGFKPAPSKAELEQDAENAAKSAAEAAAENAALDLAAKAFCRVAVPALLAPLELLEDLIPIFGEIADIAEIAATPALIQGCVKAIEKDGQAEFKVFGKKHTLSLDKPSKKPTETRPPEKTTASHKTTQSSKACSRTGASRAPAYTGCAGRVQVQKVDNDSNGCPKERRDVQDVPVQKAPTVRSLLETLKERYAWKDIVKRSKAIYFDLEHFLTKRWDGDPPDNAQWPTQPSSRTIRAWQRWYTNNAAGAENVGLGTDGGKCGGTTSLYRDLSTGPANFRFYSGQLEGCTVLVVASQTGVYMAHFWQDKAFDDYPVNDQYGHYTGRKDHDPTHYITNFLAAGRVPGTDPDDALRDGANKLIGLTTYANHFQGAAGLTAYILTPGSTTGAGLEYNTIIAAMSAQVAGILNFNNIQIIPYEPPDDKNTAEYNRVTGGMVEYQGGAVGSRVLRIALAYRSLPDITW